MSFCDRTLPEYMIPSAFATLDAFPLTPNGKMDRSALPAPDCPRRARQHDYVPPSTDVEERSRRSGSDCSSVGGSASTTTSSTLGGHSLLATQLVSRVRDALGVELPLRTVFEAPTVAGFAQAIEDVCTAGVTRACAVADPPSRRASGDARTRRGRAEVCILPASFAEQRLWFLDRLEPENRAYNLGICQEVARARWTRSALERALTDLVARHESLRTTFSVIDDVPQRVIRPPRPGAAAVDRSRRYR